MQRSEAAASDGAVPALDLRSRLLHGSVGIAMARLCDEALRLPAYERSSKVFLDHSAGVAIVAKGNVFRTYLLPRPPGETVARPHTSAPLLGSGAPVPRSCRVGSEWRLATTPRVAQRLAPRVADVDVRLQPSPTMVDATRRKKPRGIARKQSRACPLRRACTPCLQLLPHSSGAARPPACLRQ